MRFRAAASAGAAARERIESPQETSRSCRCRRSRRCGGSACGLEIDVPARCIGRVAGEALLIAVVAAGNIGPGGVVVRLLKLEDGEADVVGADDRFDIGIIETMPIDAGDGDRRVVNPSLRLRRGRSI